MIPKSGNRFSEKDHAQTKDSRMIPKSGNRFSEKIMLEAKIRARQRQRSQEQ
jgi:hypothetical protein